MFDCYSYLWLPKVLGKRRSKASLNLSSIQYFIVWWEGSIICSPKSHQLIAQCFHLFFLTILSIFFRHNVSQFTCSLCKFGHCFTTKLRLIAQCFQFNYFINELIYLYYSMFRMFSEYHLNFIDHNCTISPAFSDGQSQTVSWIR